MTDPERPDEKAGPAETPSRAPADPFRLLFICTGNTCRSPMAQALAERGASARGWTRMEIRSAGVGAWPGAAASEGAQRVAQRHGIDLTDHRSARVTPELVAWADLVLTMSPSHLAGVAEMGGSDKMEVITRFATAGGSAAEPPESTVGVRDPIGGDDREYAAAFEQLHELIGRVLDRLAPVVSP